MKRCPSCERTYTDEALSFCPNDGTPLVTDTPPPSFDPQATIMASPPKVSGPTDWPSQPPPAQQNDWTSQPPVQSSGWGDTPGSYQPSSPPMGGTGWQAPPPPPFPGGGNKQQGFAIGSLVCGILSIVCCMGLFTGIPAVILGVIAMNKEKAEPANYGGKGMAMAGTITGGIGILLSLVWIVVNIIGAMAR
jgi:hypothetical protein